MKTKKAKKEKPVYFSEDDRKSQKRGVITRSIFEAIEESRT